MIHVTPPPAHDLLKVGEAAAAWGTSARSIHRQIDLGHIPARKTPGGHHRIPRTFVRDQAVRMGLAWAIADTTPPEHHEFALAHAAIQAEETTS